MSFKKNPLVKSFLINEKRSQSPQEVFRRARGDLEFYLLGSDHGPLGLRVGWRMLAGLGCWGKSPLKALVFGFLVKQNVF